MSQRPTLSQLFQQNPQALASITNEDPYGFTRDIAEQQLSLALRAGIEGVSKVVADFGSPQKFRNLIKEVQVARLFQNLPAQAKILRDNAFGNGQTIYTPDLDVAFEDGRTILVDVTSRSSGDTDISTPLHELIEERHYPFKIDYALGPELSPSALSGNDRMNQENLVRVAISSLQRTIESLPVGTSSSALIVVKKDAEVARVKWGELRDLWEIVLKTQDHLACFILEPVSSGPGYVAGGNSSAHILDDDALKAAFLNTLKSKAQSRTKLPTTNRSQPFIVAYVCDEWALRPEMTHSALVGGKLWHFHSTIEYRKKRTREHRLSQPTVIQDAIANAYENGWKPLLDDWGHGEDAEMPFSSDGLYLDALHNPVSAWGSELDGVLVVRRDATEIQWLPNPFSKRAHDLAWLQHLAFHNTDPVVPA